MLGIVCDQPGTLRLRENLPEPVWQPGHAIVRIRRIGICGTDYHAFGGRQPFFQYPRVLGHELSGVIERIEDNEEGLAAGDPVSIVPYLHCGSCIACRGGKTNCCAGLQVLGVHADGGMRERIAVPVTHLLKTGGLTLDEAAIVEPLAIGAHAVRRAGLSAADTVLVIGAGPIGLGVAAFARRAGARVIAMDISAERLAVSRAWAGADETIHALASDPKLLLSEWTEGEFPVAVFDATGNAASMMQAFELTAHGGKLVYVGLVQSDISFSDPAFHKRELTLMGSRNATKDDFRHVMDTLRQGELDAGRYITHRAPIRGMIEAFAEWLKPESRIVKAVVAWDDE